MRLNTCANCPNYGDEKLDVRWSEKPQGTCRVEGPERSDSPPGKGEFPLMPRDGWCARHGKDQQSGTPTHTTADYLEFGPPVDQPT